MTNKLIEAADELERLLDDISDIAIENDNILMSEAVAVDTALTAYRAARESAVEVKVTQRIWGSKKVDVYTFSDDSTDEAL